MDTNLGSKGVQEILIRLEDEELFGLASTVTQGLLRNKLQTREGALEAILTYSRDLISILRRKAVTRDILFSYLHDSKVAISLPATKNDLIDIIAKHWQIVAPASDVASQNSLVTHTKNDVNTMALQFTEWFCTLMNHAEPISCEHFWTDSSLKLQLISGDTAVNDFIENDPAQIVQTLFNTKVAHNLYLNPNCVSDGVQGRLDPHGLVVVLACGTLHSDNLCVGTFEQVFMLARDPHADNNWKIKRIELNLRSKSDVSVAPNLHDNALTSNMLALPIT